MEVYKSDYWDIRFEEEKKLLIPTWNENSAQLTDELYKAEMERYANVVEECRPDKGLINCLQFYFPISLEMQEWINTTIFPRVLAVGVKRVAIVMPTEIIALLSIEQVMEEELGTRFVTAYFDTVAEARTWLLAE